MINYFRRSWLVEIFPIFFYFLWKLEKNLHDQIYIT